MKTTLVPVGFPGGGRGWNLPVRNAFGGPRQVEGTHQLRKRERDLPHPSSILCSKFPTWKSFTWNEGKRFWMKLSYSRSWSLCLEETCIFQLSWNRLLMDLEALSLNASEIKEQEARVSLPLDSAHSYLLILSLQPHSYCLGVRAGLGWGQPGAWVCCKTEGMPKPSHFFKRFIFKSSLHLMWGLNLQPWAQGLPPSPTELATHPKPSHFNAVFQISKGTQNNL